MKKMTLGSLLFMLTVFLTTLTAKADIVPPAGVTPGDQFRLIFVSSNDMNATSADIAVYDAFINATAASAGLDSYAGKHITWFALGSTATVNAKDRLPSSSIPIYNMHGDVVANATHDIWSGSLLHAIEYDETASIFLDRIWTGTHVDGTAEPGEQLGTAQPEQGNSGSSDLAWVFSEPDTPPSVVPFEFYGYSEVITVAGVPEPTSGSLLLTGIVLLGVAIRCKFQIAS